MPKTIVSYVVRSGVEYLDADGTGWTRDRSDAARFERLSSAWGNVERIIARDGGNPRALHVIKVTRKVGFRRAALLAAAKRYVEVTAAHDAAVDAFAKAEGVSRWAADLHKRHGYPEASTWIDAQHAMCEAARALYSPKPDPFAKTTPAPAPPDAMSTQFEGTRGEAAE